MAYDLELGGTESALVTLLKKLDYNKYEVDLYLEEKKGIYLKEVPPKVNVIEYKISKNKNIFFRKIKNRLKLIFTILKNKNKYDFSACYATHLTAGSIMARYFSKNNCLWIHSNYYYVYNKDVNKIKEFFANRKIEKFKSIVLVSEEAKKDLIRIYPNIQDKCHVINNLIDYQKIQRKSREKISELKPNKPLFINVARQEESSKKITRIINVAKRLKNEKLFCEFWLIGNGRDHELYKSMINDYQVQNMVKLLGSKDNPYPYFLLADYFLLTSDYEGFPVVYLEAMILNLPIITTIDVTDNYFGSISEYGIVVDNDEDDIYNTIKEVIKGKKQINKIFASSEFNAYILEKITALIDEKTD